MSWDEQVELDSWRTLPRSQWSAYDREDYRRHQERVRAREHLYQPTVDPYIAPLQVVPSGFGLHGPSKRKAGDVDRLLHKLGIRGRRR